MDQTLPRYDAVIVGAGMAGASLAAALAPHMRLLVIEAEAQPGYHATGRSVAFWSETYGGPLVRPLTLASLPAMQEGGFVTPRGALHIGRAQDTGLRDAMLAAFGPAELRPVADDELARRIPGLRAEWTVGLEEASTCDIDVATMHAAYLAACRQQGGEIRLATPFRGASWLGERWRIETGDGPVLAALLVNAAGAWADDVARASGVAPLGIAPLRRTVVQLRVDPAAPADLPLVLDLAERFYFKPVGGGRIWLTPHDEEPSLPCDAAPEELAIATAIARFEEAVDWRVLAVERRWAGLRSFAPDRLPVYGPDVREPHFFWFAGQGGFGIQTAPAAAALGAALLLGTPVPAPLDPAPYSPRRFG